MNRNLLCRSEELHAGYTRVHWCKKPGAFPFFRRDDVRDENGGRTVQPRRG